MNAQIVKKGISARTLILAVLAMTLLVLGLGGAVIAVKLRPDPLPTNAVDRAVVAWERTVDANPENATAYTGLGMALLDAGRTGDAQAAFEDALALDANDWMAGLQLALLVQEADPDRAVDLLGPAVKLAPRTSKVLPAVTLGDLQMTLGDLDAAVRAYRIAVADAPYVLEGHLGLARAYEQQGLADKAIKEYRSAARFAPDHPEVLAGLERLGAEA